MADIDQIDGSTPVSITDSLPGGLTASLRTSTPTATDAGLVVREAARGQTTAADSIPVVIASDQPAFSLTSTYVEDTLHSDGDKGLFILAVRNDAGTSLSGDGDYTPLQVDSTGALRVTVPSVPSLTDDAAFSIASSKVSPMGALVDEVATDSVDEGDVGIPRMTLDRKLLTRIVGATDSNRLDINSSGQALVRNASSYAEDSAHTNADIGSFILGVRNDSNSTLTSANGDYSPIAVDLAGRLKTVAITSKVDDTAFTIATDYVNPSGFLADEVATDSVDEGDVGLARMTLDRKLLTRVVGATDSNRLDINSSGQALVRNASSYAEDSAHTSGDVGSFILAVRNDAGTVLAGTTGDYIPLSTDSSGNLRVVTTSNSNVNIIINPNGPLVGSFSRLRVAEPFTIFDSKFSSGSASNALFWDTSTSTGGTSTFVANESTWDMDVTTTSGSQVIRQTRQYFSYQPGKSFVILMTGRMGALKTNVRQRIGYFDDNNGLFFEQDGTNLKVVQRSYVSGSPVDTAVNQSSWNLDPLDGTGASGITIDTSKVQIFFIDFQWLGTGRVRMGFDISGTIVYCHQFLTANTGTTVWATTPCLPIRYSLTNTGTTASATKMKAICSTILSEGGYNPLGIVRSAVTSTTQFHYSPSPGTYVPVISIRPKSTSIRTLLHLLEVNMMVVNNSNFIWRIEFNATLSGASWTSTGTNTNSEFDISATALSSAGEVLYITPNYANSFRQSLPPDILKVGASISGTADILTISLTRVATSAANVQGYCSLVFRELI